MRSFWQRRSEHGAWALRLLQLCLRSMTTLLQFMSLAFHGLFGLPVILFGPNIFTLSPQSHLSPSESVPSSGNHGVQSPLSVSGAYTQCFALLFCAAPVISSSHVNATPNRVAPLLDTTIFCPGTGVIRIDIFWFYFIILYLLMHWSRAILFAHSCDSEHFFASLKHRCIFWLLSVDKQRNDHIP